MIREYDPARDRSQLRACMVELQDFERGLEPGLPEGGVMADRYLANLMERCAATAGRVFVAEEDGAVAGFVGVLARVVPAPDEGQAYAYVSDLVVLPAYRRRGIGRALLERAEVYAREMGARALRVGVLVKNEAAGRLYRKIGFNDYTIQLLKPLR
jgi:ribosomal protein S18 acetylase RimI-like enzyme